MVDYNRFRVSRNYVSANYTSLKKASAMEKSPARTSVKSPSTASPAKAGSESPSSRCPICLSQIENAAYTDKCFHQFCFTCLLEWSKVNAVCPLCKQAFQTIVYDVQSYGNFKELPVLKENTALPAAGFSISGVISHRRHPVRDWTDFRSTAAYRQMLQRVEERRQQNELRHPNMRYAINGSFVFSESSRHTVYRTGMRVQYLEGRSEQVVADISPRFFAEKPACKIRLSQWLHRELNTLLQFRNRYDINTASCLIMSLLDVSRLGSRNFFNQVLPYTGGHTYHFLQELYCFTCSAPFTMSEYDSRVVYGDGTTTAIWSQWHMAENEPTVSHHEDVMRSAMLPSDRTPVSFTLSGRHVNRESDASVSAHQPSSSARRGSPIPGTSRVDAPSQWSNYVVDLCEDDDDEEITVSSVLSSNDNGNNDNSDDDDNDDDVEVIAEEAAYHARSPIVISDEDEGSSSETDTTSRRGVKNREQRPERSRKRNRDNEDDRDETDKRSKKHKKSHKRHKETGHRKNSSRHKSLDETSSKHRENDATWSEEAVGQERGGHRRDLSKESFDCSPDRLRRQERMLSEELYGLDHSHDGHSWRERLHSKESYTSDRHSHDKHRRRERTPSVESYTSDRRSRDKHRRRERTPSKESYTSDRHSRDKHRRRQERTPSIESYTSDRRSRDKHKRRERTPSEESYTIDRSHDKHRRQERTPSEDSCVSGRSHDQHRWQERMPSIESYRSSSSDKHRRWERTPSKESYRSDHLCDKNRRLERTPSYEQSRRKRSRRRSYDKQKKRGRTASEKSLGSKLRSSQSHHKDSSSFKAKSGKSLNSKTQGNQLGNRDTVLTVHEIGDFVNAVFHSSILESNPNGLKFKKHATGHKNSNLKRQTVDKICQAIENYT